MPNDNKSNFGRFVTSRQFSERVMKVVEEAVSDLERCGFTPVYDRTGEHKDKPEAK